MTSHQLLGYGSRALPHRCARALVMFIGCHGPLMCKCGHYDRIRLLGRWRSDEMLRYLHVQAYPVVASLAPAMLRHGNYTLIPNIQLPQTPPAAG